VTTLVGRTAEQVELDHLISKARDGVSSVLVVRGDAGIGKTCLLNAVVSSATDFDVVRLVGIESEMRLGFAALHQLLTPFIDGIDTLPSWQAHALRAAFGLSDEVVPDPFGVGLAALTLVTRAAEQGRPLLIVVDDTQWLDEESADALGFLARQLLADPVCFLASVRTATHNPAFEGLPTLALTPLSEEAASELLDTAAQAPLANHVRASLLAEARGNPLALIEFGRGLSSDQLVGAAPVFEPPIIDRRLERHFLSQVAALPPSCQMLLLAAAAEPTGAADVI
jgi:predicted ATPase